MSSENMAKEVGQQLINQPVVINQTTKNVQASVLSLGSLLISFLLWPITFVLHFVIIKIPTFVLQLLSTSFSITLSFSTILIILGICFVTSFFIIRYKVLTSYSKSKESESNTTAAAAANASLFNSGNDANKRRFPGSYIDEFLIAIKIFGYLEKPVFNELTKQMRTQKLSSNEFLTMDENLGFAIVVEGNVQIFTKVGSSNNDLASYGKENPGSTGATFNIDDDDIVQPETLVLNGEKYQLLNEVKTGNPLSSLINILSLFTEEDDSLSSSVMNSPEFSRVFNHSTHPQRNSFNNDIAPLDLNHINSPRQNSTLTDSPSTTQLPRSQAFELQVPTPTIIARATKDSTVAIIPASAFQRLRKKHPRSSSYIVQMILTRLHRVTFQTAHNYLGLTKEIFSSEINLNEEVQTYRQSLKCNNWFDDESTDTHEKDAPKLLINSKKLQSVGTPVKTDDKPTLQSPVTVKPNKTSASTHRPRIRKAESKHIILNHSLHDLNSNPGDLLSNVPLSSSTLSNHTHLRTHPLQTSNSVGSTNDLSTLTEVEQDDVLDGEQESTNLEELELKTTIAGGLFNFLGVTRDSLNPRESNSSISNMVSAINSPAGFGGFQTFSIVDNVPVGNTHLKTSKGFGKTRTFSTNSLHSSSSTAADSQVDDSLNYDNAKDEFSQKIQILSVEPGQVLVEQNTSSSKQNGLYYVLSGELEVLYKASKTSLIERLNEKPNKNEPKEHLVYNVKIGGVAGYLGSFVGSKSMVTIRCSSNQPCLVGFISKFDLEKLCEKYFMIYLTIAKGLIRTLNAKLLKLDSALEWIQLDAGETLFKQDTNANGIYVVLNGRLRSIKEDSSTKELKILKEYGQGESFGEVEVLTAAKRSSSFVGVRDSELARIPRNLFEILALENPSITIKMSRIVADTIRKEQVDQVVDNYYKIPSTGLSNFPDLNKNYRTITVLPTTSGLPVMEFSDRLIQAFKDVDKTVIGLDQTMTLNHLGRYAFDKLFNLRQSGYFSDLEEKYQIVTYIADTSVTSAWTSTCIQQGDCILLLADAEYGDPSTIGEYERLLLKCKTTARVELIMLHQEKYVQPGLINKWLKNRVWVDSHHHIQFNPHIKTSNNSTISLNKSQAIFQNGNLNILANTLKESVEMLKSKYIPQTARHSPMIPHYKNDFMRLARILSGQAVGIILGGGGARGFSHLGVLRALEENGIPIDIIGGTSIGSFIGGLYAQDYDLVPIYGRAKKFAGRIGSVWRMLFDLTIPTTSYTTGHEFNRGLWKIFGDIRIEDFWISFFCNSTNITNSCMEIHSNGYAWRFIRASMTLAGLLPPLAHNGSMLLDGGYVDNLPVDEMKRRGANIIFAVDVGSVDDRTPMDYGDSLSGAWSFWNKFNPFSKHPNIPSMSEIQMRLCYVSSVNALERAKATKGVIYLRPPVEDYGTLDFGKFEEIYNVGSVYGHMALKELIDEKKLPFIAGMNVDTKRVKQIQRRNSI